MGNLWMDVYHKRKLFSIGDIVFWDRARLSRANMEEVLAEFGPQYFEVLTLPYRSASTSYEWIDIGRNEIYVTRTNPLNLIKITP